MKKIKINYLEPPKNLYTLKSSCYGFLHAIMNCRSLNELQFIYYASRGSTQIKSYVISKFKI